jgi:phage host-nuclease inhibitor protein Gam
MKAKRNTSNLPVPQSREEAEDMLVEIGKLDRKIKGFELKTAEKVAALSGGLASATRDWRERHELLTDGLAAWANDNRSELTQEGQVKTVDLGTGTLSWRMRPASVRLKDAAKVIAAIKAMGLLQFLRIKEEVNREAMLAEPDAAQGIAGVAIGSTGEDLIITPNPKPTKERKS